MPVPGFNLGDFAAELRPPAALRVQRPRSDPRDPLGCRSGDHAGREPARPGSGGSQRHAGTASTSKSSRRASGKRAIDEHLPVHQADHQADRMRKLAGCSEGGRRPGGVVRSCGGRGERLAVPGARAYRDDIAWCPARERAPSCVGWRGLSARPPRSSAACACPRTWILPSDFWPREVLHAATCSRADHEQGLGLRGSGEHEPAEARPRRATPAGIRSGRPAPTVIGRTVFPPAWSSFPRAPGWDQPPRPPSPT